MSTAAFIALCRTVLAAELVLVVVFAVVIVLSAAYSRWQSSRWDAFLSRGRATLIRALASDTAGDEVGALVRLPHAVRVELTLEFGPSLAGRDLARLAALCEMIGVVALAERLCRSTFWWRRLRGARLLTALDHESVAMRALLRDGSPTVRAQALVWAAGRVDPVVIDELVRHLADPERLCRFTVQDSLLRLGRPAAAALARFLEAGRDAGLEDGLTVARGLAQPELLPPAMALASHDSSDVRARAVAVLGVLGGDASIRVLTERLADSSAVVRAAAAKATGHLGYWQASSDLARLLGDTSWPVRREAALALRRMGGAGLLTLRRALRAENPFAADMARQVLDLPDPVYARVAG